MKVRILLFVIVPLLCTLPIEAQVLTGNFIGVVRDDSRAVLPGATITVESPARPSGRSSPASTS
jgi:hypothetical protein